MAVSLTGLDRKSLRRWMLLFFLALAVPTGILIQQAYSQLKWGAYHQHQVLAEELAARIDERIKALVNTEEARAFTDYVFLVVAGDPSASFLQRSPLSEYPLQSAIPGLIGYFQVDTGGAFSTPLLPQSGVAPRDYGISGPELERRLALTERIRRILGDNRLVQGRDSGVPGRQTARAAADQLREAQHDEPVAPYSSSGTGADYAAEQAPSRAGEMLARSRIGTAPEDAIAQSAFDSLNAPPGEREQQKKQLPASRLGRVEDLKLDYRYQAESAEEAAAPVATRKALAPEKRARRERSALPESQSLASGDTEAMTVTAGTGQAELNISIFESEIDPFEFSLLDSGHLVLFRKVWRDGQRYIQGVLLEQGPFLQGTIEAAFRETALSQMSDLIVAYRGEVIAAFSGRAARQTLSSAEDLSGALLYQTRLSDPLGALEMIFSITRLPAGPAGRVVTWVAVILALVLCGGFYLMYRLGAGQIDLARQQQDFVSAVSHELKTPLTSIRMYGEMLREGWAPEEKKKTYYDYIFTESERLSRLITNVLQLARMTRNELVVDLKPVTAAELMDGIRSKVATQVEGAGFTLNLNCEGKAAQAVIGVDSDFFTQILINLVDNALKFSGKAETRVIDIGCRLQRDGRVSFSVRDYGPGVPREQMKKIFKLFYRSENELTRETVGTGIGLALVHQLALAMHGQVDVVNSEPGAEFRVSFKSG